MSEIKIIKDTRPKKEPPKNITVEEKSYNDHGKLFRKTQTKYDADGNIKNVITWSGENFIISICCYKYDANGRVIEEIEDSRVENRTYKYISSYREDGTLKERKYYVERKKKFKLSSTEHYNSKGNLTGFDDVNPLNFEDEEI